MFYIIIIMKLSLKIPPFLSIITFSASLNSNHSYQYLKSLEKNDIKILSLLRILLKLRVLELTIRRNNTNIKFVINIVPPIIGYLLLKLRIIQEIKIFLLNILIITGNQSRSHIVFN